MSGIARKIRHLAAPALLGIALATGPLWAQDTRETELRFPDSVTPAPRPFPSEIFLQVKPGPEVIETHIPAVPGAEEFLEDSPNALFWSRYQVGTLNGWQYRLFPDGSGVILPDPEAAEIAGTDATLYLLECVAGAQCEIFADGAVQETVPAVGAPKPALPETAAGLSLARYLGQWVLAGTGTPPPPPTLPAPADVPPEEPLVTRAAAVPEELDPVLWDSPACLEPDPFYPDACDALPPPEAAQVPPETIPADTTDPVQATDPSETADTPAGQPAPASANAAAAPPRQTGSAPGTTARPPETDKAPASLAMQFIKSCSVSTGGTIQYTDHEDFTTEYGKMRVSLGCSLRPTDRFSFRVSVVRYPIPDQQAPWDPDYTYALNYRLNDHVSISYSSYTARFSGEGAEALSSILNGGLRANIKLPPVSVGEKRRLACSFSFSLREVMDNSASLGCGMSLSPKLRVGLTTYVYPRGAQEPWSPDYTYTVTYRINDRLQLGYANYSNNRFPWNQSSSTGPGPLGASVTLTYKLFK